MGWTDRTWKIAGKLTLGCSLVACAGTTRAARDDIPLLATPAPPPPAPIARVGVPAPTRFPGHPKARVTVVHFWASWAVTCNRTLPALEELATRHPDVAVIAISLEEEKDQADAFARLHGLKNATYVFDRGRALTTAWSPSLMPSTYLIDSANVVQLVRGGSSDQDLPALEREVALLMKQP